MLGRLETVRWAEVVACGGHVHVSARVLADVSVRGGGRRMTWICLRCFSELRPHLGINEGHTLYKEDGQKRAQAYRRASAWILRGLRGVGMTTYIMRPTHLLSGVLFLILGSSSDSKASWRRCTKAVDRITPDERHRSYCKKSSRHGFTKITHLYQSVSQ